MRISQKTRNKHWPTGLLLACFLFILLPLSVQATNIDSLKTLAQEAPFPERMKHIMTWYQATNQVFHEPEIAIVQSAIDWLEKRPQMTSKQLGSWSNFQLMLAGMNADNENIKEIFKAASKVVVMADSIGKGQDKWQRQKGKAYFYLYTSAYL